MRELIETGRSHQKSIRIILWVSMFFLLIMQYQNVYLYYDDYGYMSLTYGYQAVENRSDIVFSDVLRYCMELHQVTDGRIVQHLLLAICAMFGGLPVLRVLMPMGIVAIYLALYKRIIDAGGGYTEYKKTLYQLILLCSYGVFSAMFVRNGLYWFSASVLYVLPIWLYLILDDVFRKKNTVMSSAIAFVLCITSEQSVAATIMYVLVKMLLMVRNGEKLTAKCVAPLIAALVGGGILITSPGFTKRKLSGGNAQYYEEPLFRRMIDSYNELLDTFFRWMGPLFILSFMLMMVLVAIRLIRRENKIASVLALLVNVGAMLYVVVYKENAYRPEYGWVWLIYFILTFVELISYYLGKNVEDIPFIVSAYATVGMMVFVPELPLRVFTFFAFFVQYSFVRVLSDEKGKALHGAELLLCLIFMGLCVKNFGTIYTGYKQNAYVLMYNDHQLQAASRCIENGETIEEVKLFMIPDMLYSGEQLYFNTADYMQYWMNDYYNLPDETIYVYQELNGEGEQSYCVLKSE